MKSALFKFSTIVLAAAVYSDILKNVTKHSLLKNLNKRYIVINYYSNIYWWFSTVSNASPKLLLMCHDSTKRICIEFFFAWCIVNRLTVDSRYFCLSCLKLSVPDLRSNVT